jgi:hypothetical protein
VFIHPLSSCIYRPRRARPGTECSETAGSKAQARTATRSSTTSHPAPLPCHHRKRSRPNLGCHYHHYIGRGTR